MLAKVVVALLAVAVGCGLAVQSVVNAGLARGMASGVVAATVSFWVGTLALTTISVAGGGLPAALASGRSLGWAWWIVGGLLGACFVTSMTLLVPRLGIASTTAFVIAGQLTAAAVLDHFGLLGLDIQPLTLARLAGIGLLIAGAVLVRLY
ncbi:DMT family transporter [Hansschlegelia sp. KR7-227]|uniref:DMT family transporter n=1 Tax=Hansschlegelia sp. KR7-227 TaxID=3400914 RepID=UPI003C045566